MKHCRFCGHDNSDTSKFCSECGRNLEYKIQNNNPPKPVNDCNPENNGNVWRKITDGLDGCYNVWVKIMGGVFVIATWLSIIKSCT